MTTGKAQGLSTMGDGGGGLVIMAGVEGGSAGVVLEGDVALEGDVDAAGALYMGGGESVLTTDTAPQRRRSAGVSAPLLLTTATALMGVSVPTGESATAKASTGVAAATEVAAFSGVTVITEVEVHWARVAKNEKSPRSNCAHVC